MTLKSIFEKLKGEWTLRRTLGNYGIIHGFATISETDMKNNLLYYEKFKLEKFNKSHLYCYKEYQYSYENEKIIKYFSKNNKKEQIFYELEFTHKTKAVGYHDCNLDYYEAVYNFIAPYNFSLEYKVTGPNKNYIIKTEFNKVILF